MALLDECEALQPLLASKSHRLKAAPETDEVAAPDDRISAKVKGLDVVIKNLLYADY